MPEFFAELRIKNDAIIDAVTFLERHQILLSFDKKASKFGELLEDIIDELEGDIYNILGMNLKILFKKILLKSKNIWTKSENYLILLKFITKTNLFSF